MDHTVAKRVWGPDDDEGRDNQHWSLQFDWQDNSTMKLLWLWTGPLGRKSYLTAGLLFGLTLPGVSAHGFLRGGGMERIIYLIHIISI